ncbi:hypothetical protein ACLKA6_015143 [Drosophila palustris]
MAQKVLRNVTHCIFDMDGLLLDTETLYTLAAQMVLDPFGLKYTFEVKEKIMGLQTRPVAEFMVHYYDLPMTWEEYAKQQLQNTRTLMGDAKLMPAGSFGRPYPEAVRFRVMGTQEKRSAEIAIDECQLPITVGDFLKRYHKMCGERMRNVPLLEGAERLLRHLHANKVPFALATSSGAEMVELKTTNHRELFNLFNHRVCGSSDKEVKNGKPAPDIFLIAAARFSDKPKPENCLVFEDSPNGVSAGESAGMQTIMVPDPRLSKDRCSHATQVLRSLEDFKPEQFGLPAFKN